MKRLMAWFRLLVLLIRKPKDDPLPTESEAPAPLDRAEPGAPAEPVVIARAVEPPPPAAPPPPPEPVPEAPAPQDEAPEPSVEPKPNRKERRRLEKWERERRKHDVFVTPKAPDFVPARKPHVKHESPPKPKRELVDEPAYDACWDLIDGEDGKVYTEKEWQGEFTFRDTVLEQLELYWVYLRRMKTYDPDAYEFYKQVGATIVPPITHFLNDGIVPERKDQWSGYKTAKINLTPWWKENRPGFGCVSYGLTKKVESQEDATDGTEGRYIVPKFFYFIKYSKPPPEVQPTGGGDVYKLTIWWDRRYNKKWRKGGTPTEYAVFLDKEGIKVLRMLNTKMVRVGKRGNNLNYDLIPQRAWRIDPIYKQWAKDDGEDCEHMLARMFMETANTFERANYSMIRVAVHNGDLTAQFSVDPRRMSYFFQDRDIVYTPGGAREHCFHSVRAHERHMANGKVAAVKLHFRGAKEFTWAGYRVTVTVPGDDHVALAEVDVPVIDSYWSARKEKTLPMAGMGELIQRVVEGQSIGQAMDVVEKKYDMPSSKKPG